MCPLKAPRVRIPLSPLEKVQYVGDNDIMKTSKDISFDVYKNMLEEIGLQDVTSIIGELLTQSDFVKARCTLPDHYHKKWVEYAREHLLFYGIDDSRLIDLVVRNYSYSVITTVYERGGFKSSICSGFKFALNTDGTIEIWKD